MRSPAKACLALSVFLATGALSQEIVRDVDRVVIDVPPIASPGIRSLVVALRLDLDHDQYLTAAEVDMAISEVWRAIDADQRRARTRGWLDQSRARTASASSMRNLRPRPADDYAATVMINSEYGSRLQELNFARQEIVAAGSEWSLMSEDFHALFSHLPPEQRHALLEADVEGNNDGVVTAQEFYLHNRRVFSKKTRFESDFGEEAYLEVLRLLGVL